MPWRYGGFRNRVFHAIDPNGDHGDVVEPTLERAIDPIELQTFLALYRKRLSYFLPPLERR